MAQIMLLGLFVLLISIVWIMIVAGLSESHKRMTDNSYKKLLDCYISGNPHKWAYNKSDRLQCTECGVIAGSYETDEGDYNG